MIEQIFVYVGYISIAWVLTHIKEFIKEFLDMIEKPKRILSLPIRVISCFKCATFWLTLGLSLNLPLACFLSLVSDQLDRRGIIIWQVKL